MTNVEHYFENLLFHGHDIKGEPNKKALSKEVQDAVEQCADYIKYTYKDAGRKTGKWIDNVLFSECSICGKSVGPKRFNYCPHCGNPMEVDE